MPESSDNTIVRSVFNLHIVKVDSGMTLIIKIGVRFSNTQICMLYPPPNYIA